MNKAFRAGFIAVLAFAFAALPAHAQSFTPRTGNQQVQPLQQHVFVPNFGLRPVLQERFPVFGLGFDAHHFHVTRRHHFLRRHGFHGGFGFKSGKFFLNGFFGHAPFFHPAAFAGSSVVVAPQPPPAAPQTVIIQNFGDSGETNTAASTRGVAPPPGLPANWNQLRVEPPSYARPQPAVNRPTLLVLKDGTLLAAQDYWLEVDRIFYVTSTGQQASLAVGDLDWEMTIHLNEQRNVTFVLRSEP